MLTLTDDAVTVVNTLIASADMPEGSGMRISRVGDAADNATGEGVALQLSLVEAPMEGDQIVEEPRVFVDPAAAEVLDDKVLHAEIIEDQVHFTVADQA